jgi:uncharacterized membrane protein YhaH (DUF805 family)
MGIFDAYIRAMTSYRDVSGRASRGQFFGYIFVLAAILGILAFIDIRVTGGPSFFFVVGILGHLLPSLAISVRRLHDIDWSGFALLLAIIPYVGWVILAVSAFGPSYPGTNKYGPQQPLGEQDSSDRDYTLGYWLGRRVALLRRGLLDRSSWVPQAKSVPPLPDAPESLAVELGVLPSGGTPGKLSASAQLQRLQSLRTSGMISEAEFIRLSKVRGG